MQRVSQPVGMQKTTATAEGEVLNTITVQAYIALYKTVCGMTATAVHVGEHPTTVRPGAHVGDE